MSRQQRLTAMRAGRQAGRLGLSVDACPYDPAGSPDDRARASAWVREYVANSADAQSAVSFED